MTVFLFWFCRNLALVRADISRLPFASCSVDAIHAGAAIHCWPSPSNAVQFLICTFDLCSCANIPKKKIKIYVVIQHVTAQYLIKICIVLNKTTDETGMLINHTLTFSIGTVLKF
jgi:hypothetical protein